MNYNINYIKIFIVIDSIIEYRIFHLLTNAVKEC